MEVLHNFSDFSHRPKNEGPDVYGLGGIITCQREDDRAVCVVTKCDCRPAGIAPRSDGNVAKTLRNAKHLAHILGKFPILTPPQWILLSLARVKDRGRLS